jgi:ClpP class serine protease
MSDPTRQHERILAAIQSEPWAITPAGLNQIIAIAEGLGDPQALIAKLGRPLENTRKVIQRGSVALIPVTGPIFRYANLFTEVSGATSLDVLATDFAFARDNPQISHIIQVLDTPGGQASGISEYAQMIRDANVIKPVISYVSNLGASAGYWIAAASGEIVIADTALLGSVGVVLNGRKNKATDTWEIVSAQSPKKRVDPTTEAGRAELQSLVDGLAQIFIESVAAYRGVSVEKALADFGQGGLLIGRKAVQAGMADRVGSLESLISKLSAGVSGRSNSKGVTMSVPNTSNQPLTQESLAAEHPEIFKAIRDEGFVAGAEFERERIKSVEAQVMPGHEALIDALKFDGHTSGPEAAVQVLAAEKSRLSTMRANLRSDAPAPVPHAPVPDPAPKPKDAPKTGTAAEFDAAVAQYQKDGKTRGQSIVAAAESHPVAHQAWIQANNQR